MGFSEDLLKLIDKYDIIKNEDDASNTCMASLEERLKKDYNHKFKITQLATGSRRWQTYYKFEGEQRKIVRANSKKSLLEKLLLIYEAHSHIGNKIFIELFSEWLEEKKQEVSSNTIKRHKQYYKRYFENSELHNMEIQNINKRLLKKECIRIIQEFHLSRKGWNNVKSLLNGMFIYAIDCDYLSENLMTKIVLPKNIFHQDEIKSEKDEIFNEEEVKSLKHYLDLMYADTNDSIYMAIRVNFLLGLRVGELVALQWDNIIDNKYMRIKCAETRDQCKNVYRVAKHTKGHQERLVPLSSEALEILSKVSQQDTYIFTKNGERITSRQVNYALEKYAKLHGLPVKRSHCIRRTYASMLSAKNIPVEIIRITMGHKDLSTTCGYIYNTFTNEKTYELITGAL